MEKIIRTMSGILMVIAGVSTLVFSGIQVFHGQIIWVVITIAGGALIVAGVRLMAGDRLRDILADLLFVFFRTH